MNDRANILQNSDILRDIMAEYGNEPYNRPAPELDLDRIDLYHQLNNGAPYIDTSWGFTQRGLTIQHAANSWSGFNLLTAVTTPPPNYQTSEIVRKNWEWVVQRRRALWIGGFFGPFAPGQAPATIQAEVILNRSRTPIINPSPSLQPSGVTVDIEHMQLTPAVSGGSFPTILDFSFYCPAGWYPQIAFFGNAAGSYQYSIGIFSQVLLPGQSFPPNNNIHVSPLTIRQVASES